MYLGNTRTELYDLLSLIYYLLLLQKGEFIHYNLFLSLMWYIYIVLLHT